MHLSDKQRAEDVGKTQTDQLLEDLPCPFAGVWREEQGGESSYSPMPGADLWDDDSAE